MLVVAQQPVHAWLGDDKATAWPVRSGPVHLCCLMSLHSLSRGLQSLSSCLAAEQAPQVLAALLLAVQPLLAQLSCSEASVYWH